VRRKRSLIELLLPAT